MKVIEKKSLKEAYKYLNKHPGKDFLFDVNGINVKIVEYSEYERERKLFTNSLMLGLMLGIVGGFFVEFLFKFLENVLELGNLFYISGLILSGICLYYIIRLMKNMHLPL